MMQDKKQDANEYCIRLSVLVFSGNGYWYDGQDIIRVIDILPEQTLEDLHWAIFRALNRDERGGFLFTFNKMSYISRAAVVFSDEGGEEFRGFFEKGVTFDAYETELGSLKLKPNKVFYYYFDFSDSWWHKIRVVSVKTPVVKDRKYPYVVERIGDSPKQDFSGCGW